MNRLRPELRAVLNLLAQGMQSAEMAEVLGVTTFIARYRVVCLLEALGARTRAQAVSRGYELELLPDDS